MQGAPRSCGAATTTRLASTTTTAMLALALILTCAAAQAAAAAATEAGDACVLLHMRDRNMAALERAANDAAGLKGPRAGAYLTPEQVADLTGRSQRELQSLATFLRGLGGHMSLVGPLRDLALACFPAGASALATGAAGSGGSQTSEQQEVVEVTQAAIDQLRAGAAAVSTGAAAAAQAVAAALPPSLARFVAHVEPLAGASPAQAELAATGGASLRRQLLEADTGPATPRWTGPAFAQRGAPLGPARFGEGKVVAAAESSNWRPVSGTLQLNVSSGYGPPLPSPLGKWNGWVYGDTGFGWGIPQFPQTSLLFSLGVSDAAAILNNINTLSTATAVMLPCRVELGPNNTVRGVSYATTANAAACAGTFTLTYYVSYAGTPNAISKRQTVVLPSSAVRVMGCSEAVARSGGRLPLSTCSSIGSQMAAATNLSASIGDATALYILDPSAVLPTYVGLVGVNMSVHLAASVPALYRPFGVLSAATSSYPISIAGRNLPSELRRLYNAPPDGTGRGTARGLSVGVQVFVPAPYAYSPKDMEAANMALGYVAPPVINNRNDPLFVENKPAVCYSGAPSACKEPSLDIQMITQFGQGSGSSFGFAASSNNQAFVNLTHPQLFRGVLGLKPLPDVLSWSYGMQSMTPASKPQQGDAVLAKMAAMGLTVIVSSGDWGAFVVISATLDASNACRQPVGASYPAASPWVTAVGAVMEARVAPGRKPQLVACMAPIGGDITSGGGFGNVSLGTTPAWQAKVVRRYVASQQARPDWPLSPANARRGGRWSKRCTQPYKGRPSSCVYGRGYPDVSLVGAAVPIMAAGTPYRVYGTSVTAPVFAGLVMHLNAAVRATQGLEGCKLGFLNPFLYWAAERYPSAFQDVTVGSNRYNMGIPQDCGVGYNAAPGWDAVTGLGVPNIGVLEKAAVDYVRLQGGCAK